MSDTVSTDSDIEKILDDITLNNIPSLQECNKEIKDVIDIVFKDNLKYEKNKENKKNILKTLNNSYQFVDIEKLNSCAWVCYIDIDKFYDLKIHFSGLFLKFKDDKKVLLKYGKKYYNVNVENKVFFRKLSNKNLLKMYLLDTIN